MKRLDYIDCVKGIAILLMLWSHSMATENAVRTWICSFNMPIFFVICGMLLYVRELKGGVTAAGTVKRRVSQLAIPYFVFGFIYVGYYVGMAKLAGNPLPIREHLLDVLTFRGICSIWFLPVYVCSEIVGVFLLNACHKIGGGQIVDIDSVNCCCCGRYICTYASTVWS